MHASLLIPFSVLLFFLLSTSTFYFPGLDSWTEKYQKCLQLAMMIEDT